MSWADSVWVTRSHECGPFHLATGIYHSFLYFFFDSSTLYGVSHDVVPSVNAIMVCQCWAPDYHVSLKTSDKDPSDSHRKGVLNNTKIHSLLLSFRLPTIELQR